MEDFCIENMWFVVNVKYDLLFTEILLQMWQFVVQRLFTNGRVYFVFGDVDRHD